MKTARHCEKRNDVAILKQTLKPGLLRYARDDRAIFVNQLEYISIYGNNADPVEDDSGRF
jgi:hypothetical protein